MIHILPSFAEKLRSKDLSTAGHNFLSIFAQPFDFPATTRLALLATRCLAELLIGTLSNAVTAFTFKLGLPGFNVTGNGISYLGNYPFGYPILFLLVTGVHVQLVFGVHCKFSKLTNFLRCKSPNVPTGLKSLSVRLS
ncbi:hypothetical protein Csa_005162 [Cucumis sativus]|uniref:Uncharacterized protein n=1 Tax=Cucumis sativus TaxID=3659 RepID=A0A0A0KDD4_CUCSA|nr:hypothetical protein Csa_005162 [Cucumis sativus]